MEVNIMPRLMNHEDVIKRIFEIHGDKYSVISKYENKRSPLTLKCNIHNVEWTVIAENALRKDKPTGCPECAREKHRVSRTRVLEVKCAYCGEIIKKTPFEIEQSKNKIFFCCREHKDIGQSKQFGLTEIWPEHYDSGDGVSSYRNNAFIKYGKKCSNCGFEEDERLIDVHHIDSDRSHNTLENLIPLCVMCHAKITRGIAKIENRRLVDIS